MNTDHIVSSFDADLNRIESLVLEMGGLVEQQLLTCTKALKLGDRSLAKDVIRNDAKINALEAEVNQMSIELLALRQPMASDLRTVVMTLKIANHLERVGDYIKNMARRTNTITKADAFIGSVSTLTRMSAKVQVMINDALDAYNRRDPEAAETVRGDDEDVDQMHNGLFRELLTYMMEDTRNISGCMHLLFIAKNIERMGDHAAEIAGETVYLVTGEWPTDKRVKGDRTSRMIFTPEELGEAE